LFAQVTFPEFGSQVLLRGLTAISGKGIFSSGSKKNKIIGKWRENGRKALPRTGSVWRFGSSCSFLTLWALYIPSRGRTKTWRMRRTRVSGQRSRRSTRRPSCAPTTPEGTGQGGRAGGPYTPAVYVPSPRDYVAGFFLCRYPPWEILHRPRASEKKKKLKMPLIIPIVNENAFNHLPIFGSHP